MQEPKLAEVTVSAGQVFSDRVSVPIGWVVARLAIRRDVHPSVLTMVGLVFAISSAVALAAHEQRGLQIAAIVGFQLAYVFDCADGLVARATKKMSRAGGELDVLVDLAGQWCLVTAVSVIALDVGGARAWLVGAFAVGWTVSIVTTLLARLRLDTWESGTLGPASPLVWLTRQVRDHPTVVLVLTVAAVFSPARGLTWVLAGLVVLNGGIVAVHIAARFRKSVRPTSE